MLLLPCVRASKGQVKKAVQGRMTVKCVRDDADIEETLCSLEYYVKSLLMNNISVKGNTALFYTMRRCGVPAWRQ